MKPLLPSLALAACALSALAADPTPRPRATPKPIPQPSAVPDFKPQVQVVLPNEIRVVAYIDGVAELHVTKTGLFWVNGMYAKPGLHGDHNWPTYINGQAWFPRWQKPTEARGVDTSAPFPLAVLSLELDLELHAVGEKPDAPGVEPRSPITVSRNGDELIVTIPDPEFGPRWYNFVLVPVAKK